MIDPESGSAARPTGPVFEPDDDAGTLIGDIRRLRVQGYRHGFTASADGRLRCPSCDDLAEPAVMQVEEIVRYEGESNPEDESILLAVRCPCGTKGYFTSAFGSAATAADALVLARFT